MRDEIGASRHGEVGVVEPGWYPDPWSHPRSNSRRQVVRWWNGTSWTESTARVDSPAEEFSTLPVRTGVLVFATLVVSLVGSRLSIDVLVERDLPIVVLVAIGAIVGYVPPLVVALRMVRIPGRSRLWVAGRWRSSDLGWGPLTWLGCVVGQIVAALVVFAAKIPFVGNVEDLDSGDLPRDYLVSILVIGVIVAPVVEEILFRGVILRSLSTKGRWWSAVLVQGLLFGIVHIDPVRGSGNLGLVIVLSTVGVVLGFSTWHLRRIWPAMIAHGILNAVALALALSSFG